MGILTATPSIVTIFNVAAGPVSIAVETTNNAGPISASLADGSFVTLSGAPISGASGTLTLTPINPQGGDDTLTISDGVDTLQIPIALGSSALPTVPTTAGHTLQYAMTYVQAIADAPTAPSSATVGLFLNEAIIQVGDDLNSILQTVQLPITYGTSTVTLPDDIGDIIEILYNTGDLNIPGSIPYEVIELGPGEFSDFNAGIGGTYGLIAAGPVLYYTRLSDTSGRIRLQFAPYPPPGFFVIYYHARIALYDLTNTSSVNNMDPSYFKLVIYKAAMEICLQQRDTARADYLEKLYDKLMAQKKITSGRRNYARKSTVRDVTTYGYDAMPNWFP